MNTISHTGTENEIRMPWSIDRVDSAQATPVRRAIRSRSSQVQDFFCSRSLPCLLRRQSSLPSTVFKQGLPVHMEKRLTRSASYPCLEEKPLLDLSGSFSTLCRWFTKPPQRSTRNESTNRPCVAATCILRVAILHLSPILIL